MIIVIGAGLSGLCAGFYLRKEFRIFEKENCPGGLSRTINTSKAYYDFGGHWLHLQHAWTKELIFEILKIDMHRHCRDARIYLDSKFGKYPFQNNLAGYSPDIIYECITGMIKAKYRHQEQPKTFEDYINMSMGEGIGKHFMVPYNQKLWGIHPRDMSIDWMGRFVPSPDIDKVLRSIIYTDQKDTQGYNETFFYPAHKGIGVIPQKIAECIKDKIEYSNQIVQVNLLQKTITLKDGRIEKFEKLVNTMPLKELIACTIDLPDQIRKAGDLLNWTDITVYNLCLSDFKGNYNWCYFPNKDIPFFRQGNYSIVASDAAPDGTTSIYVEYSSRLDKNSYIPRENEIVDKLKEIGLVSCDSKIIDKLTIQIKYAYVVYDMNHKQCVKTILDYFESHNVYSIGRYGAWEYSSMEDAMLAGRKCAESLNI